MTSLNAQIRSLAPALNGASLVSGWTSSPTTRAMLKAYRGDLAVISYDDEHALRFITAMHKIGLSAPEDFQIIGHNNDEAGK